MGGEELGATTSGVTSKVWSWEIEGHLRCLRSISVLSEEHAVLEL